MVLVPEHGGVVSPDPVVHLVAGDLVLVHTNGVMEVLLKKKRHVSIRKKLGAQAQLTYFLAKETLSIRRAKVMLFLYCRGLGPRSFVLLAERAADEEKPAPLRPVNPETCILIP